jgi:hypothetical protein
MMRRLFVAAVLLSLPAALSAQSSESRYDKEFVFPLYMRNVSFGASPVILREFMIHVHDDTQLSVVMPPVHLAAEQSIWDLGRAGSVGSGLFLSHGRYKYSYLYDDGYGGDAVNIRVGMTQVLAGVSYHYTIRTRLEAYARVMFGAGLSGFHSDRAGATYDWSGVFIWNGVAGMRWFFSNSFGVYAEGGYTSGCVNAGITYRW